MPVNKERVMKLVERLRDPESKQATGVLRLPSNHKKMCCLGHACEVYRLETGEGKWDRTEFIVNGQIPGGVLPQKVAEWYGFTSANPIIHLAGEGEWETCASEWNDSYKKSLAEIADGFEALCAE